MDERTRRGATQYAKLRPSLRSTRADPKESLGRIASAVHADRSVTVQLRIAEEDRARPRYWAVEIGPRQGKVSSGRADKPDIEIVARSKTVDDILAGRLSPIEAFVTGRMRLRGDADLGKELFRSMAAEGVVDVC